LKFTVEGYVSVDVKVIENDAIEVIIKDTGVGINEED